MSAPSSTSRAPRGWLLRLLVLALVALGMDQVVHRTVLADGRLLAQPIAPFDPPLFTGHQFEHLAKVEAAAAGDADVLAQSIFDPELGWCPREGSLTHLATYDWSGARLGTGPLPRERTPGVRRLVVVGGSFTHGAEVAGPEAWPSVLDQGRDDLEVANLGVPGYGLDQALLRYRRDGAVLGPDEVWFGLMPDATLRVTSHYGPNFFRWSTMCAFKPRFVLDREGDGTDTLRLVANPAPTHAETLRLLTDQEAFVDALGPTDHWVRRTPAAFAPAGTSWTHHFAASRLALTWRAGGERDLAAWLEDEESEVYRLMRALLLRLRDDVEADGSAFRIVVLPSRPDLASLAERGRAFWTPLLADLEERGVATFDPSAAMLEAGFLQDPDAWAPRGHYSAVGNARVAERLAAALLD